MVINCAFKIRVWTIEIDSFWITRFFEAEYIWSTGFEYSGKEKWGWSRSKKAKKWNTITFASF